MLAPEQKQVNIQNQGELNQKVKMRRGGEVLTYYSVVVTEMQLSQGWCMVGMGGTDGGTRQR